MFYQRQILQIYLLHINIKRAQKIPGVRTTGQVYIVNDYTVLKMCRIYQLPSDNTSTRALWDSTIFGRGSRLPE